MLEKLRKKRNQEGNALLAASYAIVTLAQSYDSNQRTSLTDSSLITVNYQVLEKNVLKKKMKKKKKRDISYLLIRNRIEF